MIRKRIALTAVGALALSIFSFAGAASAHNGPEICAFTSATGLPANVNNVEGKGGSWSIISSGTNQGYWTGSEDYNGSSFGGDGDPMRAQDNGSLIAGTSNDRFQHANQTVNQDRRGLYYPVNDPDSSHLTVVANPGGFPSQSSFKGDHFNWYNSEQCNNNGAFSTTNGVGVGYCGRSVGLGLGSSNGHPVIVQWESVGSQLILTHSSAAGSLNAQPNPPGSANGSCLTGSATTFNLNGVLTHQ